MNKPNYNEIIKTARKTKGLTQQELADEAGVSLRTIQRIEKGTEEISGFSLRQISKVLDIPLEEIIMQNVNQISIDENQNGSIKALYLSSLLLFINPLLGLIVPLIIGYYKQNKNDLYKINLKKIVKINIIGISILAVLIISLITGIITIIAPEFSNSRDSVLIFLTPVLYYLFMVLFIGYNFFKLNKVNNNQTT
jgi:transcriptional regulator with XRE-family HTH domain